MPITPPYTTANNAGKEIAMSSDPKYSTQSALHGKLSLPEKKPDVDFLLRVTSTPFIDKIVVLDKTIMFSGHILVCVEYVARLPDCAQPLCFSSFELPFEGAISHCKARTCMNAQLQAAIKLQEFQALDARSITYLIVVKVQVSRLLKEGEPCPLQCSSPCLTLCKPVKVQKCPPLSPCEEIQLPEEPCGFPVEGPPPYMMKPPPPQHIHHHSCCTHAPASVCTVCGRFIEMPPV